MVTSPWPFVALFGFLSLATLEAMLTILILGCCTVFLAELSSLFLLADTITGSTEGIGLPEIVNKQLSLENNKLP